MSILMEQAANGHKKSMITLYEENKGKLYAFCSILLNDKEKAAELTINVMNEVWGAFEEDGIKTERKFNQYLITGAAKQCRPAVTVKDVKASNKQMQNKVYTGDVADGFTCLQAALKEIVQKAGIFLLVNAGGLNVKEIGQVIKQKETVAKAHYDSAVAALAEVLAKKGDGKLQVEYAKSLLEQAVKVESVPKSVDTACLAKIKECAKRPTIDKKFYPPLILIGACVVVVLIVGIIELVKAYQEDKLDKIANEYNITLLDESATYYADIVIEDYGKITVKLDEESAPLTTANFVNLATEGFYDGLTFHRIMDGFMMQGGDPEGNGTGGAENKIPGEFSANGFENNLSHTRGAISMARSNEFDSASSQFFIMQEDNTSLDGQYAAFGYVTEGMDVVDAVCAAAEPTDNNGTIAEEDQPKISYIIVRKRYE